MFIYLKVCTVKISNLKRTRNSVRIVRLNELDFLILFQIFMIILFGRIELAINLNKPSIQWISMQKRLLTRVRYGRTES